MFKVGDRVRIKEDAFPGSFDPYDVAARGQVGTITANWNDELGEDWEVEIEELGDIFPVAESEIELVQ